VVTPLFRLDAGEAAFVYMNVVYRKLSEADVLFEWLAVNSFSVTPNAAMLSFTMKPSTQPTS
jgi:hypothetical protein